MMYWLKDRHNKVLSWRVIKRSTAFVQAEQWLASAASLVLHWLVQPLCLFGYQLTITSNHIHAGVQCSCYELTLLILTLLIPLCHLLPQLVNNFWHLLPFPPVPTHSFCRKWSSLTKVYERNDKRFCFFYLLGPLFWHDPAGWTHSMVSVQLHHRPRSSSPMSNLNLARQSSLIILS